MQQKYSRPMAGRTVLVTGDSGGSGQGLHALTHHRRDLLPVELRRDLSRT